MMQIHNTEKFAQLGYLVPVVAIAAIFQANAEQLKNELDETDSPSIDVLRQSDALDAHCVKASCWVKTR